MNTYEIVTERIVEKLKKGEVPWRSPYLVKKLGQLQNIKTKHYYSGINLFLLCDAPLGKFLTYKQAQELGGQVKKGAKGYPVVFFKNFTPESFKSDPEKCEEKIPCMRYYTVFDLSDIEGIEYDHPRMVEPRSDCEINQICEQTIKSYTEREKIELRSERPDMAYYSPTNDYISIPDRGYFINDQAYYQTLFHEMTHSTGHATRLDRKIVGKNHHSIDQYSKEELIAEMGSAFLCSKTGMLDDSIIEVSASYLNNWIKILKGDPKLIVSAAGKAQKAVNFILKENSDLAE